jgi:hypothetical protein
MAFVNMVNELRGSIPKLPTDLAKTFINRAWGDLRGQSLWSFLLFEDRWVSPPVISVGTVTLTQGSNLVVADATAGAAITAGALAPTLITQRQFRAGLTGAYNIWGWDPIGLVLTLDKPFMEASSVGHSYSIFQSYYAAPMKDFKTFISVRDMQNFQSLFLNRYTREQLDQMDPQRTWYYMPTDVVYYQQGQNPASPTYAWPMFELWGAPQTNLVWQLYGIRKGADLVLPGDLLPPAVGEDCVLALARKYAYEWAEANKGDNPRNVGPDFRYLIGVAQADYNRLYKDYRKEDRELVDCFFSAHRLGDWGQFAQYNTLSGTASPGGFPW